MVFNEQRILTLIGYRKAHKINPAVLKLIAEEGDKIHSLLRPAALYTILDYSETNRHSIFNHADQVAICVCTIGPDLEKKSTELLEKNDILRGLIWDAFGSEAVEQIANKTDLMIADKALRMGLWPSKRFSPGYRHWPLEEQRFIFRMLPAGKIGVRLNAAFMMIPRKSISFRVNFYKDKSLTTRKIFS